ncbi:MAG: hypothetical protein R2789_01345 [Microthrixaceae bacterium]
MRLAHPTLGEFPMQNVVPKLSDTPGRSAGWDPNWGTHRRGAHKLLGRSPEEIEGLHEAGIV